MNKIIIFLLSIYVGFMACSVKKQVHQSTLLADSLLQTEQERLNKQSVHHKLLFGVSDSIDAHAVWKDLSIDSIIWKPRLIYPESIPSVWMYGIHLNNTKQKMAAVFKSALALKKNDSFYNKAVRSVNLHDWSQKKIIDKDSSRSLKHIGWWWVCILIVLVGIYCFRKKIGAILKFFL